MTAMMKMDTEERDMSEYRANNRMLSQRKYSDIGERRVYLNSASNPFEVTGTTSMTRPSEYPTSELNQSSVAYIAPFRSAFPSTAPLYFDFEYHSPPKWYQQQRERVALMTLNAQSKQFMDIARRVKSTLNCEILRIEKVKNSILYQGFAEKHEAVSRLEGAAEPILELFYGTGRVDPYLLCTNLHGLDSPSIQVFSQPMTCFTSTAKAASKFAYRKKDNTRVILLCLVTVGDPVDLSVEDDISEPPARLGPGGIVLSARIAKRKSTIWVVYERKMSYPAYVITLRGQSTITNSV